MPHDIPASSMKYGENMRRHGFRMLMIYRFPSEFIFLALLLFAPLSSFEIRRHSYRCWKQEIQSIAK